MSKAKQKQRKLIAQKKALKNENRKQNKQMTNVILKSRFIEMAEYLQMQNCSECDAILNDLYNHQLDAMGEIIVSDDVRLTRLIMKFKELKGEFYPV